MKQGALGIAMACLLTVSATVSRATEVCPVDRAASDAHGLIVVISAPPERGFRNVHVVLDGAVQGKITRENLHVCIATAAGMHIVGINEGRAASIRQRIAVEPNTIVYLRYAADVDLKGAGLLGTTTWTENSLAFMDSYQAQQLLATNERRLKKKRR